MRDDDEARRPAAPPTHQIGQDLSRLSVDEIGERIALLEDEIARLREDLRRKQASRDAASALFRS